MKTNSQNWKFLVPTEILPTPRPDKELHPWCNISQNVYVTACTKSKHSRLCKQIVSKQTLYMGMRNETRREEGNSLPCLASSD